MSHVHSPEPPEDLSKEAEEVVYTVLGHNELESAHVPIDPNFLNFTDLAVDFKYNVKIMGLKGDEEAMSDTLKNNLILFNLVLFAFCACALSATVVLYSRNRMNSSELIFHLLFLVGMMLAGVAILITIIRSVKMRYRMKRIYLCFLLLIIFYLVFGDHRVFAQVSGGSVSVHHMNYTIVILVFLFLYKLVSFSHFLGVLVLTLYTLALYMVAFMVTAGQDRIAIVADCAYILMFSVLLCVRTHQTEYRARNLFWRLEREEEAIDAKSVDMAGYQGNSDHALSTEIERLIELCDNIKRKIKAASAIIMFNEVKTQLKEAQTDLEKIKRKIARGNLNELVKLELHQGMDEEDRAFIIQQYYDVSITESRRNSTSSRVATMQDRRASIVHFDEYGVEELNSVLLSIGKNWNFDIWYVHKTTGHSVLLVARYLIRKWEFNGALSIAEKVTDLFFQRLELGYRSNPYHNACHAADVCHSLLFFIENSEIMKNLTGNDLIGAIIAALGHDLGHPALTNRFLIANRDKMALRYNDQSVLENMHVAKIFKLLSNKDCDILQTLPADDWMHVRKVIISMILHTDMGKHFEYLGQFRTRATTISDISLDNTEDKIFVLSMGLKAADLGNAAKNDDLHQKWANLVCEELFNQGDQEKKLGMPVSMYCDRDTTDVPKCQIGFIKNICLPLYEVWATFLNSAEITSSCLEQLRKNLSMWESRSKARRGSVRVDPIKASPAEKKPPSVFDLKGGKKVE